MTRYWVNGGQCSCLRDNNGRQHWNSQTNKHILEHVVNEWSERMNIRVCQRPVDPRVLLQTNSEERVHVLSTDMVFGVYLQFL